MGNFYRVAYDTFSTEDAWYPEEELEILIVLCVKKNNAEDPVLKKVMRELIEEQ